MSTRARRLLLAAAEDDATFERARLGAGEYLVGRCIHCQSRITVPLDPREPAHATLEHIVPRNHGGTDAIENLAIACRRCNHGKGVRLDARRRGDPDLARVTELLLERRRARARAR